MYMFLFRHYNTVIRTKLAMYIHRQQKTVLSQGGGRRDGLEALCITCALVCSGQNDSP